MNRLAVLRPNAIPTATLPPRLLDLLFLNALARRATLIRVAPDPSHPGRHELIIKRGKRTLMASYLPAALATPLLFRLAALAMLDPSAQAAQTGRLVVRQDDRDVECFVSVTSSQTLPRFAEVRILDDEVADAPAADAARAPAGASEAALPAVLPAGTEVGSHVIVEPLGRGGMGIVYRAHHTLLAKQRAIKVLHRSVLSQDPNAAERFLHEARVAARIDSDAIVNVTDVGLLADGRPYLVMELLDGVSLAEFLEVRGALLPIDAVDIAREIARALAAAHAVGVIHRDVSPSNVFVLRNPNGPDHLGVIKLVDFGTAHLVDSAGQNPWMDPDMVIGTPLYMAPEHARGRPCDGRTDLYALGVVLFELLAGTAPYQHETVQGVVLQHLHKAVPIPTSPHHKIPDSLVEIVTTLMEKEPHDRFQSASQVIAALDAVADEHGWHRTRQSGRAQTAKLSGDRPANGSEGT